ncbi:recombinase family protein, partial [Arthrobacter sp. MAHUQ-56]
RIRAARAGGASMARIAADLNADGVATGHGGAQWYPSTVKAVLDSMAHESLEGFSAAPGAGDAQVEDAQVVAEDAHGEDAQDRT